MMSFGSIRVRVCVSVIACAVLTVGGCKPSTSQESLSTPSPSPSPDDPAATLVEFAPGFECDEPAVPELLTKAVRACIDQDYEAFRLLWSAREDPISEKEFIRAWRASPKFTLKEMHKMKTPEGEVFYAVRAFVSLDPNEVPEPERDIVLCVVNESGQWRLKKAPRKLNKLLKKIDEAEGENTNHDSTTPPPVEASTNGG